MAEKKKYNSILVSGRKDETLTYSKYVKDEESRESVKESLDKKVNVTDELTTQQIKDGAITNEKIKDKNVTNEKLADNSVSNEKIKDKSITNSKLDDNSVDGRNLSNSSVENRHIGNNAVSTSKIASQSVTNEKIAYNSVSRAELTPDVRSSIDKKADAEQVNNSLYNLEKKIGDRFVVEGDVANLPDEEDLTSVKESEHDVLKLADRSYAPYNFSGKGYKILRKNIKQVSLAVTTIVVSAVPTSDGYISFIINGVESHVDVVASSDTTTDKVAGKIAEKLTETMTEYEVSKDASTITLTRKFGGKVSTPSSFSVVSTGVSCSVEDSSKIELRNLLTAVMLSEPNTIYEVRYDFDLDGETIEMQEGCTLKFEGGSLRNGKIKGNMTSIDSQPTLIFLDITFSEKWNVPFVYAEYFGAIGDGCSDDTKAFKQCIYSGFNIRLLEKTYLVSDTLYVNTGKQFIQGTSGRSKIYTKTELPNGLLVLYSHFSNDWVQRPNRVCQIGNFTLIANSKTDGLVVGGAAGTEYEGHVDEMNINNIFIDTSKRAILLNSHLYKIIFMNICQRSAYESPLCHADDANDVGEVTLFINCSFWDTNAPIKIRFATKFYSCTFHTYMEFKGATGMSSLHACHFEFIGNLDEEHKRKYLVYSNNHNVSIIDADATTGGTLHYDNLFVHEGNNGGIVVKGGDWKYYITHVQLSGDNTLCKGNVTLIGMHFPFFFDMNTNLLKNGFYDYTTKNLFYLTNKYINEPFRCYATFNQSFVTQNSDDGCVNLTCKDFYGGLASIYKIIQIPYTAGSLCISIVLELENDVIVHFKQNEFPSTLSFLDINKNPITDTSNSAISNTYKGDGEQNICFLFAIPKKARYVVAGLTMDGVFNSRIIKIKQFKIEFL